MAALLEPVLAPLNLSDSVLHTTAYLVGFIVFSSLQIVIGEQVPKTPVIRKPEAISLSIAYPLHFFYALLFPLNWALNSASRTILRMLNVAEAPRTEIYSNEEIHGLAGASAEQGEMYPQRATFIHNIFRFDERLAEEVMISWEECHWLQLDVPPEENLRVIQDMKHSRFPVMEDGFGNLVGMVLIKDVVDALLSGASKPWRDIGKFFREPLVVPETIMVSRLFETMRSARARICHSS